MAITIPRGKADSVINEIIQALDEYQAHHPRSQIDVYRYDPVSVRIRVIDPEFKRRSVPERHEAVWKYLRSVSDAAQGDVSTLVLVTPAEKKRSIANLEFEDPVPSDF